MQGGGDNSLGGPSPGNGPGPPAGYQQRGLPYRRPDGPQTHHSDRRSEASKPLSIGHSGIRRPTLSVIPCGIPELIPHFAGRLICSKTGTTSNRPGTPGAQGRERDDDLYSRPEPRTCGRPEPGQPLPGRRPTPRRNRLRGHAASHGEVQCPSRKAAPFWQAVRADILPLNQPEPVSPEKE